MIENQLQCDDGGEFVTKPFLTPLDASSIQQLVLCPHTLQQDGLAERKHMRT